MILNLLNLLISSISFLYTFHVLYLFMYFTSVKKASNQDLKINLKENDYWVSLILWKLFINTCLLSMFMFQHSFMASLNIKNIYEKLNIHHLERSLYNVLSAGFLHVMIHNWQFIQWIPLWKIDISSNNISWFIFTCFNVFGWFIIYGGCVVLDIAEIMGIEQIYKKISGVSCPIKKKSKEYQRYLTHMRHPSFIGFTIIFWIRPVMSCDWFLLSTFFTIYMLLMWAIDEKDFDYHAFNIYRKRKELFELF